MERRRLCCALHEGTFAWTDPASGPSLAAARQRLAFEHSLSPPRASRDLRAAASTTAVGIPRLNSNPDAPVQIYLDFDGDAGGGVRGVQMVTPYDTNGDGAVFDAVEAAVVTQAWSLVSTYFAMFDVNVTTDTPTRPFAWVAIGNNIVGGYSYVGVFPQRLTGTPESFTSSAFARTRATGIAHEIGHNFGLSHQADFNDLGKLLNEYSVGYDDQHGPFMGVDYARKVHKWQLGHASTGLPNAASALQDDLDVIAQRIASVGGGDGYRLDDVGATLVNATPLDVVGVDQMRDGIIERTDDVDVFAFTSTGGRSLIAANPQIESGVDLKLEVRDASNRLLASEDLPNNDAQLALDLPAGTYYASVSSHGNYGDLGAYRLTVSPLAAGFDTSDVGVLNKRAGHASLDPATGVWTLSGGGGGIGGASDGLRYAYQSLSGDGSIVARVSDLGGGGAGSLATAGLMIRDSLAAGARHATVAVQADRAVDFIRRTTANATSTATRVADGAALAWLRLTRVGDALTVARSNDGIEWTSVGSQTLAMGDRVYIGLAVSSHNDNEVATARFDHVTVDGITGPLVYAANGLPAPANVTVAPGLGTALHVAWEAVAGATMYGVERSTDGLNFFDAGVATTTTTFVDATLTGAARYFYRVRALTNAAGRSHASAVVSAVNRPGAPTHLTTMSLLTTQVQIDWRDTTGEAGYRIERSADGITWATRGYADPNHNGYTDAAPAATTWRYRVVPLSDLGDGPASDVVVEGTRLPVVQGVRIVRSTSDALSVAWNDLNRSETNYRIERSTDAAAWTLVGTVGGDVTSYVDRAGLGPLTRYVYRVTATNAYTEGINGGVGFGATQAQPSTQSPPLGWGGIDVGGLIGPGASGYDASTSTHTLISAGADVGGGADEFRFVYRRMSGDGEIVARVTNVDTVDALTRAGVMIRESLAATSRFAFAGVAPRSLGVQFDRRTAAGTNTLSTSSPGVSTPLWLKLSRVGDLVTAARSADGVTWTTIGADAVTMTGTIYVGLALTAHATRAQSLATFANVGGSAIAQGDSTPPAPPMLDVSDDTGVSATDRRTRDATLAFNGTAEPGSIVRLDRDGTAVAQVEVRFDGTWTLDPPSTPLTDGTYLFSATAIDASANAGISTTMTVIVDTVAPALTTATFDRERDHRWVIVFDEDVAGSFTPSDVALVDVRTSRVVTPAMTYDASTHTATLTLPDATRLADGRYELRLAAGAVSDLAGNATTSPTVVTTNVLAGDADGNGVVDFGDLVILARNFGTRGKMLSSGNVDYDAAGRVDFDDLLLIARTLGKTLPPLAAPFAATAPTRRRPLGIGSSTSGLI